MCFQCFPVATCGTAAKKSPKAFLAPRKEVLAPQKENNQPQKDKNWE